MRRHGSVILPRPWDETTRVIGNSLASHEDYQKLAYRSFGMRVIAGRRPVGDLARGFLIIFHVKRTPHGGELGCGQLDWAVSRIPSTCIVRRRWAGPPSRPTYEPRNRTQSISDTVDRWVHPSSQA